MRGPIVLDKMFSACYNPPLMNKLLNFVVLLVTSFVISIANASQVFADGTYGQSGCVPVYGGGVQCPRVGQVLINKTVRNSSTGIFVDNLGPTDPKYRPDWMVKFHLTISNTGDETLSKVTVTDKLPDFVDFTSGPGNYDSNTKTLTFDVFDLAGGSSQTYEITAKVVHPAVLPADKSVTCVVNNVTAVTASQTDSDSSQFCIEKEMIVPSVPSAGPEHWILSIAGLGTALTIGLYLRKKAIIS